MGGTGLLLWTTGSLKGESRVYARGATGPTHCMVSLCSKRRFLLFYFLCVCIRECVCVCRPEDNLRGHPQERHPPHLRQGLEFTIWQELTGHHPPEPSPPSSASPSLGLHTHTFHFCIVFRDQNLVLRFAKAALPAGQSPQANILFYYFICHTNFLGYGRTRLLL